MALKQHIVRQDFDCNQGKPFCEICNSTMAAVAAACLANPACVAFTVDEVKGCAYLKGSATDLQSSAVHVTYCIPGKAPGCRDKSESQGLLSPPRLSNVHVHVASSCKRHSYRPQLFMTPFSTAALSIKYRICTRLPA